MCGMTLMWKMLHSWCKSILKMLTLCITGYLWWLSMWLFFKSQKTKRDTGSEVAVCRSWCESLAFCSGSTWGCRLHYNACFVNSHRAASCIQTPRLQALRYGQEDADLVRALQVSRPDTRDCVVSSLFLFIPDLPAHRSPTASVTFS